MAQRDATVSAQIREVQLSFYKALSWTSSGYDSKTVDELLASQTPALDRLAANLQATFPQPTPINS